MTTGVVVLVAVVAAALAFGMARRRRDGRLRSPEPSPAPLELGTPLGRKATLVQFSSSFCAPCRATRRLLADVAARGDGVAHIEIDVADRMDLVRLLDIRRTPTVLVLGPRGEITQRASGVPRRDQVVAAVALTSTRDTGRGHA